MLKNLLSVEFYMYVIMVILMLSLHLCVMQLAILINVLFQLGDGQMLGWIKLVGPNLTLFLATGNFVMRSLVQGRSGNYLAYSEFLERKDHWEFEMWS